MSEKTIGGGLMTNAEYHVLKSELAEFGGSMPSSPIAVRRLQDPAYRAGLRQAWVELYSEKGVEEARSLAFNLYIDLLDTISLMEKRAEAAEQLVADLRRVLEQVEWVTGAGGFERCAWCNEMDDSGHAPDCARQKALGLA